jgi:NDP-sugar pyrophosphorylase family protein
LDIGRPEDYEKANTDIREIYGRLGLNANDIIE